MACPKPAHEARVYALFLERLHQCFAELVVAHTAQERHGGAEESSGGSLVRALAAVVGGELGVRDRLARLGAALDLQDEVWVEWIPVRRRRTWGPYWRNSETFSFVTSFTSTGMFFGHGLTIDDPS